MNHILEEIEDMMKQAASGLEGPMNGLVEEKKVNLCTYLGSIAMTKRKQEESVGAAEVQSSRKVSKKVAAKEESGSDEDNHADASGDDSSSNEDEDDKAENGDGLADMMSKILNQNIGAKVRLVM